MTFMTWTPAMSVGVDQLDDDHKGLIDVINDLATESSGEGRAAVLRQSLVSLRRYAETTLRARGAGHAGPAAFPACRAITASTRTS